MDASKRRAVGESDTRGLKKNTTSDSWSFRANDELDADLVVIRDLGGGDRYEVFEAWDRRLFARVAVKALRPHRVAEERSRAGLRREGEIGSRLAHPNLVRLLRFSDALPRPHLVLELVTARSVEDHLENVGPVRVAETCLLGIRTLAALQYMHAEQVLHLDVKPANVTMGDPPPPGPEPRPTGVVDHARPGDRHAVLHGAGAVPARGAHAGDGHLRSWGDAL